MPANSVSAAAIRCLLLCVILGPGAELASCADPSSEKLLFEENFSGPLDDRWSWHHEIRDRWKIDAERKELLIQPVAGWMTNLRNVPLRAVLNAAKEGPIAIEVHIEQVARGDYEFAGLMWYFDDQNFVVIRKGPHGDDGKTVALLEIKDGKGKWIEKVPYENPAVDLRMVVTETKAEAWYRAASTDKWHPIGEVSVPDGSTAKIGLRTGNGEGDKPTWARFSKLRVLQIEAKN